MLLWTRCARGPWAGGTVPEPASRAGRALVESDPPPAPPTDGQATRAPEPASEPCRGSGGRARLPGGVLVAAAMALCSAAAGVASATLHTADLRRGPVPGLAREHARATVEVKVTGDPWAVAPRTHGPRQTPGTIVVPAQISRVDFEGTDTGGLRAPALLFVRSHEAPAITASTASGEAAGGDSRESARSAVHATPDREEEWLDLLPSSRLRVDARFQLPDAPEHGARDLAAVLSVQDGEPPAILEGPSALQRTAGGLRAGLREASDGLAADARALLPGLVVGDTTRVPEELDEAFRTTDMLHLLAVSGGNLTILLVLLIGPPGTASRAERRGIAPRLGISLRGTVLLSGSVILGFVVVCRPEPSVLRAAACGLITVLAIGTGRRRSMLPALAAAVLLLVLWHPWLAQDFGFALSVLATASLLLLAPRWSMALRRRGVPGRLAEALAAAGAAQAVCAPVVVVLSGHVSLVAVPCNLLAEFAVAPATVLGFAALAVAPFAMPVATALAWLAGWPTGGIAVIARTGADVPGAVVAWPDSWAGALLLAGLSAAMAVLARRLPRHPWLSACCAVLLLLALLRPQGVTRPLTGWPPPDWRVVTCDVGQGDALVLASGDHSAVVVDSGPDPDAVDDCLRALGVTTVPLVLLTHFHADHVTGLPGVLRGRAVGAIQTTGLAEPPGQAAFVRRTAREAGIPMTRAAPGERRQVGSLSWRVLWPDGNGDPSTSGGSEDGANNSSVTMLVRSGKLTLFLPGDLEPDAQRELLDTHPGLPQVDVLKVAHHGSGRQDAELLRRLSPRIALISCGADNNYGHPAPRTVHALRREGALVLRTDISGALSVTGSGDAVVRRPGQERP
ncbi:ComEC/Rec2 family competence protein [Streptomyces oceani]